MSEEKLKRKLDDAARAIEDCNNTISGETSAHMMCPACGYIKVRSVRNVERPYVTVVWQCLCGRRNHTKIRTDLPKYYSWKYDESGKMED